MDHNILTISKIIFGDRSKWNQITDKDKEKFFFVFNRYFSKKYPDLSILLNDKTQDKSMGMDLIFNFFKNKPYPDWFWNSQKTSNGSKVGPDSFLEEIMINLDLGKEEVLFLEKYYPDQIKQEISYIQKLKKENF
jgi:hypothetical protein